MVISTKVFKTLYIVFTTETAECNMVSFAGDRFCLWSPGEAAAESTFYAERNRFSMCRLCRLLKGFDFHCSSLVLLFGRKTVLAMKYSTAPTQVEAASSGSTASSYVFGPKQVLRGEYCTVYFGAFKVCVLLWSREEICSVRVSFSQKWTQTSICKGSNKTGTPGSRFTVLIDEIWVKDLHKNDKFTNAFKLTVSVAGVSK